MHRLTPPSAGAAPSSQNPSAGPYSEVNGTGAACPLDFSITSSSSSCDDRQPMNLTDRLPAGASLGPFQPDPPDGLRRKYPSKPAHLDGHVRDYSNKVGTKTTREFFNETTEGLFFFFLFLSSNLKKGVLLWNCL